MKKLLSIVLTVLMAALFAAGCQKDPEPAPVVEIYTPAPMETAAPSLEPTAVPSDAPTPEPTEVPTQADQSVFDDAVFIGNSVFEGLYRFGIITHGRFYTKVGLNVNSVFTAYIDNSSVPVIDELNTGHYTKVILYFGTNELGWPSYPGFIEKYTAVMDAVSARQPDAKIYICGVLPTSRENDEKNENGINNENILRMNEMLKELAKNKNAKFIEVPEEFYDANGCLPEGASTDGIHLNLEYDRIWAEHICLKVMGLK